MSLSTIEFITNAEKKNDTIEIHFPVIIGIRRHQRHHEVISEVIKVFIIILTAVWLAIEL